MEAPRVTAGLLTPDERAAITAAKKTIDKIVDINVQVILFGVVSTVVLVILLTVYRCCTSSGTAIGFGVAGGIGSGWASCQLFFRPKRERLFRHLGELLAKPATRSALWKLGMLDQISNDLGMELHAYGILKNPGNFTIRRRVMKLYREAMA